VTARSGRSPRRCRRCCGRGHEAEHLALPLGHAAGAGEDLGCNLLRSPGGYSEIRRGSDHVSGWAGAESRAGEDYGAFLTRALQTVPVRFRKALPFPVALPAELAAILTSDMHNSSCESFP